MKSLQQLSDLSNRVALVTGATGGLGKIISVTLAELGADLVLVDRPGSNFDEVKNFISSYSKGNVINFECDLENQKQRDVLIKKMYSTLKKLNILVNNAAFVGTSDLKGWSVPFEKQSIDTWRRALEVNLTAVFELCQGLTPVMKNSQGATIINISSIYGLHGPDWNLYEGTNFGNPAGYAISKSGLLGLTRWLATTIAPEIRVNAIAPGGIRNNQPNSFIKKYSQKTLLGRMANYEDMKGAVSYLASDLSSYVTGQILSVDGGWH